MTVSSRDEWLRAFFGEDRQSRHVPPDPESRLLRKIQMIDDSTWIMTCGFYQAITLRSSAASPLAP
jgi:plasmid maintenance system killer protein